MDKYNKNLVRRYFVCRLETKIDKKKARGITDTIFIVRKMQEKFRAKGKKHLELVEKFCYLGDQ